MSIGAKPIEQLLSADFNHQSAMTNWVDYQSFACDLHDDIISKFDSSPVLVAALNQYEHFISNYAKEPIILEFTINDITSIVIHIIVNTFPDGSGGRNHN